MSDSATPTTADPGQDADGQQTFSLDYVKSLREEAAKHRTAKQTAVDELSAKHEKALAKALAEAQAASDTKLAEALSESSAKDLVVAKLKVAFEMNVPADKLDSFLDTVQGSTPDEVAESAKKLSDLVGGFQSGTKAFDPTQGMGGQTPPLNGNPLLKSLQQKLGM